MTILQPKQPFILSNFVIILLVVAVALAGVWLVASYNRMIELKHRIADTASDLERARTGSAESRDRMFALLGATDFSSFAADRGLVTDRAPSYVTPNEPWALASRY